MIQTCRRVLLLASLGAVLCLLTPAAVTASSAPNAGRTAFVASAGHNAFGLRLGLLCFVGLVLAGGAYAQYQAIVTVRRGQSAASRPRHVVVPGDTVRPFLRTLPPQPGPARAPNADRPRTQAVPADWPANARRSHDLAALRPIHLVAQAGPTRQRAQMAMSRDLAEQDCLRAITAACRYDRHTTLAAFSSALARNPEVKPSSLPGFWDMPSGGHADLARAYLSCGQQLDARSILTVAMMLSPHNRELEALMREVSPPARLASPLRSQG